MRSSAHSGTPTDSELFNNVRCVTQIMEVTLKQAVISYVKCERGFFPP